MIGWVVGLALGFIHFDDVDDLGQLLILFGPAGFLEVAELDDGPFELAGEALAVHAQVGQGFGLAFERCGDSQGVDERVAGRG